MSTVLVTMCAQAVWGAEWPAYLQEWAEGGVLVLPPGTDHYSFHPPGPNADLELYQWPRFHALAPPLSTPLIGCICSRGYKQPALTLSQLTVTLTHHFRVRTRGCGWLGHRLDSSMGGWHIGLLPTCWPPPRHTFQPPVHLLYTFCSSTTPNKPLFSEETSTVRKTSCRPSGSTLMDRPGMSTLSWGWAEGGWTGGI